MTHLPEASPARAWILERLREDLLGPQTADEVIVRDRPSDRYLTGILYPQRVPVAEEEDQKLDSNGADDDETNGTEKEAAPLSNTRRPASCGLSFASRSAGKPEATIVIECATYSPIAPPSEKDLENSGAATESAESGKGKPRRERPSWQRTPHRVELVGLMLETRTIPLSDRGLEGLELFMKVAPWQGSGHLVTLALVNQNVIEDGEGREETERKSFFQVSLTATPRNGTSFPPRPSRRVALDADGRMSALLYRKAVEYAVGHTCSAEWDSDDSGNASRLRTTWLPQSHVATMSPDGSEEFAALRDEESALKPLTAAWLVNADEQARIKALRLLTAAYTGWIANQREYARTIGAGFQKQAEVHLQACEQIRDRINAGIDTIESDPAVLAAFRLANQAMLIQRRWTRPAEPELEWRPFQLGFILLALPSVVKRDHPDREVMDLLWFPTGGGKTEAYLALIALTVFYRRLRDAEAPEKGNGVAAIMRYTLRLLTTQQFQRATALILACEFIRRENERPTGFKANLGPEPFSIGLWVGDDAVANNYDEAAVALGGNGFKTPAQIQKCPACNARLEWTAKDDVREIHVYCNNGECALSRSGTQLPVWTLDSDVYRVLPSLLIGTVDKFAQLVRKTQAGGFFGRGDTEPPDLIIQDELHLISGPLGSMVGLYETAIDLLCKYNGALPKVIGSTATIRKAEDQSRSLFNRSTCQFPPPGIDANDSGFAVPDAEAPGRIYLGITTAGRSAKFSLQSSTATLLQSASSPELDDGDRDPYWTLVAYFNSLRELGGALVMMHDDVPASIRDYAGRRSEPLRTIPTVDELTSRITQREVRDKLEELDRPYSSGNAIDVLLASNMISVGVDIPRLGLMVVNGQPKGIAEYIQATSRVGRGRIPGIVVTVYNSGKARDRSHFESFTTWHSMLYRDVEATSVTPFAARARDRALHAVVVGLVRHTVADMATSPVMTPDGVKQAKEIVSEIHDRVVAVDSTEVADLDRQLRQIVEDWDHRAGLKRYWNDKARNTSLLISAEKAAALRAAGRPTGAAWPTPNSMRNVEPGTVMGIVEGLAASVTGGTGNGE